MLLIVFPLLKSDFLKGVNILYALPLIYAPGMSCFATSSNRLLHCVWAAIFIWSDPVKRRGSRSGKCRHFPMRVYRVHKFHHISLLPYSAYSSKSSLSFPGRNLDISQHKKPELQ